MNFNLSYIFYGNEEIPAIVQKKKFYKFLSIEYILNKEKKIFMISNNSNTNPIFLKLHNFKNINIIDTSKYIFFENIDFYLIENIKNIICELLLYKEINTEYKSHNINYSDFFEKIENKYFSNKNIEEFKKFLQKNKEKFKENFYYISLNQIFKFFNIEYELIDENSITVENYIDIIQNYNINIIINSLKNNYFFHEEILDKNVIYEANILSFNIKQLAENYNILNKKRNKYSLYINLFNINSNYYNIYKFSLILNNLFYFLNKNVNMFYYRLPVISFEILKTLHNLLYINKVNYNLIFTNFDERIKKDPINNITNFIKTKDNFWSDYLILNNHFVKDLIELENKRKNKKENFIISLEKEETFINLIKKNINNINFDKFKNVEAKLEKFINILDFIYKLNEYESIEYNKKIILLINLFDSFIKIDIIEFIKLLENKKIYDLETLENYIFNKKF